MLFRVNVETWTDRFRNLGDGNQNQIETRIMIAKVLIEALHGDRGIPDKVQIQRVLFNTEIIQVYRQIIHVYRHKGKSRDRGQSLG